MVWYVFSSSRCCIVDGKLRLFYFYDIVSDRVVVLFLYRYTPRNMVSTICMASEPSLTNGLKAASFLWTGKKWNGMLFFFAVLYCVVNSSEYCGALRALDMVRCIVSDKVWDNRPWVMVGMSYPFLSFQKTERWILCRTMRGKDEGACLVGHVYYVFHVLIFIPLSVDMVLWASFIIAHSFALLGLWPSDRSGWLIQSCCAQVLHFGWSQRRWSTYDSRIRKKLHNICTFQLSMVLRWRILHYFLGHGYVPVKCTLAYERWEHLKNPDRTPMD